MGLIRLILAYSVVLNHSGPVHGYFLIPSNAAVTLFFMISGFYMALVMTEKYTGPNRIRRFYSNRILRLYPTYFISVILMIGVESYLHQRTRGEYVGAWQADHAVLPWSAKMALLIPNVALVGSDLPWMFYYGRMSGWHFRLGQYPAVPPDAVRTGRYLVLNPAWSIGLELWFYLLVPFIALWRTRSLVILALISLIVRSAMEWQAPWSSYFFFPANVCFFVWGMLAYRIYRSQRYTRVATQSRVTAVFLIVVTALVLRQYIPFYRNHDWKLYLLFGATLPCLFHASNNWRLDRWIGNLSYPIYLIHASVLLFLEIGYGISSGVIAVVASTLAALILLVAVEEPLERFRQRRAIRGVKDAKPVDGVSPVPSIRKAAVRGN
jgi:peptidoglycan/LPS O-acetylase OafA/YrhL